MPFVQPPSIKVLRIVTLVFPTLACVVTVFRLGVRTRAGIWWWDDAFALLSMCLLAAAAGLSWVVYTADPATLSRQTKIGMYYGLAECFNTVIWAARLSILFTIIRIAPMPYERKQLYWMVPLFAASWVIVFGQVFWICADQPGWKDREVVQCSLGKQTAVTQLVTDTLADFILVVAPLRLLWTLRVRPSLRIRLLALFSTSVITTIVSLVHAIIVLKVGGLPEAMAATFEVSFALIVCNIPVVVTAIPRLCGRRVREREETPKGTTMMFARGEGSDLSTLELTSVSISRSAHGPDSRPQTETTMQLEEFDISADPGQWIFKGDRDLQQEKQGSHEVAIYSLPQKDI